MDYMTLKEAAEKSVSYTHLDVYKRQGYGKIPQTFSK